MILGDLIAGGDKLLDGVQGNTVLLRAVKHAFIMNLKSSYE